jgi:hypothetical protein
MSRIVSPLFWFCMWGAVGTESVSITASFEAPLDLVSPEAWASLTFWDYSVFNAQAVPSGTKDKYAFLSRMELFTATGGCCESRY